MSQLFGFVLFLVALVLVFTLGRVSIEGKFMLAFGVLAFSAFLRLHFYLLLFTALTLFSFVAVAFLWAWLASAKIEVVREVKDEAMVGERLPLTYTVTSRSLLPFCHVTVWDHVLRMRDARWVLLIHNTETPRPVPPLQRIMRFLGIISGSEDEESGIECSPGAGRCGETLAGTPGSAGEEPDERRRRKLSALHRLLMKADLLYQPITEHAIDVLMDSLTRDYEFEKPGYLNFVRVDRRNALSGTMHVIPRVRGEARFGPIAVDGGDPFGIIRLRRQVRCSDYVLVLPSWVRLSALPVVPGRLGQREQRLMVSREGQSHELLGVRPFSEGDSLRRVHWPLTARHDELIVKQFEREIEQEMLVVLDADMSFDLGPPQANPFERLITVALSIVHSVSERGRPWTLLIVGREKQVFSHKSKEALLQVQYSLAELEADRTDGIENHLEAIRRDYPDSSCVLLTGRTDEGPAVALARVDSLAGRAGGSMIVRATGRTLTLVFPGQLHGKASGEFSRGAAQLQVEHVVESDDDIRDLFAKVPF